MKILVAGIGNIFFGDDGFGSEVVRRASERLADSGVRMIDYGIRGMHLAYDLLDEWDALVLVDAIPNRGSPGTLHVFAANHETPLETVALDAHSMDPAAVFASLAALGGTPPYTVVVGCEADSVDERIGLSDPVAAVVEAAVDAVDQIVTDLKSGAGRKASP